MSETTRGGAVLARLSKVGISKSEFAERASIDRSTLDRALSDAPEVSPRTWAKIDRALDDLDDELGMAESGSLITTTVEYGGAKITVKGSPADVAATVRQILA